MDATEGEIGGVLDFRHLFEVNKKIFRIKLEGVSNFERRFGFQILGPISKRPLVRKTVGNFVESLIEMLQNRECSINF